MKGSTLLLPIMLLQLLVVPVLVSRAMLYYYNIVNTLFRLVTNYILHLLTLIRTSLFKKRL